MGRLLLLRSYTKINAKEKRSSLFSLSVGDEDSKFCKAGTKPDPLEPSQM